jgi:hypothetical protein
VAENENNRVVCKFCVVLSVIKKYQLGYRTQLLKNSSKELWTVRSFFFFFSIKVEELRISGKRLYEKEAN